MIKLLIGGSPCTFWSIAQKNNRETVPKGQGWELFKNYLIAKEKFQPNYFLYENNKSMANPIKECISDNFGYEPYLINSALVSAQRRERYYWTNIPNISQPKDRGILLKDILELGENLTNGTESINFENKKESNCKRIINKTKGTDSKSCTLTASCYKGAGSDGMPVVAQPVRVGHMNKGSQGDGIYAIDGKSICLSANGGGRGAKTGLYAIPLEFINGMPTKAVSSIDGKEYVIYKVADRKITINGVIYPIKLEDGYYIIRKLTVTECCRLQTMPDDYCRAVSATQGYKGLGNGWTAEVIIHILRHANIPLDEEILVLSMYDGIGTGRYCLDKMGYKNIKYYAYEIDKYAIQIAMSNYPDIVQCGDAFQVKNKDWKIE